MATQLKIAELEGCKSYFRWLCEKIIPEDHRYLIVTTQEGKEIFQKLLETGCSDNEDIQKVKLCKLMFDTDFRWDPDICPEDETQATNGMDLRHRYAEDVGKESGKSDRDIDRIWKSVHGKCSVLEFLVHLCNRLDEMTNEEESGSTIGKFFDRFLENLEIDITSGEDEWRDIIDRFMDRKYKENGSGGGLFPLKNTVKDMRKVAIWYQMNYWVTENLNDEAGFEQ